MSSTERLYVACPNGELKEQPELNRLVRKFVNSIDSLWTTDHRLTQTQQSKIEDVMSILVENSQNASKIVERVIAKNVVNKVDCEGDLWFRLSNLMDATEKETEIPVRYTPSTFAASLEAFAQDHVSEFERLEAEKVEATSAFGLSKERIDSLKEDVDIILENPEYIRKYTQAIVDFYPGDKIPPTEQKTLITQYFAGGKEKNEVQGMLSSDGTCQYQSDQLAKELSMKYPDLGALRVSADVSPALCVHQVTVVVADKEQQDRLLSLQKKREFPLISRQNLSDPTIPPFSEMAIIDATILQVFDSNSFLEEIPYSKRIPFAKSLAPDNFTKTGAFVGKYSDYIRLLGLLGHRLCSL